MTEKLDSKKIIKIKGLLFKSHFLDVKYDSAIMGFNPVNDSIIYNFNDMLNIVMKEYEDNFEGDINDPIIDSIEWTSFYDDCSQDVRNMFETEWLTEARFKNEFEGKVPPSVLSAFDKNSPFFDFK